MGLIKKLFGEPIRRLDPTAAGSEIYLTFDDGPDPKGTARVLDLLKKYGAKATFFVIASKAKRESALLGRIVAEGHALGNHSEDHTYGVFFGSLDSMRTWIEKSEATLREAGIMSHVGFRPPVGIRTRKLVEILRERGLPMILWSHRSFDTAIPFTTKRAQKMLASLDAGAIVLLHDRQRSAYLDEFLCGLEYLLRETDRRGLVKAALSPRHISSYQTGA